MQVEVTRWEDGKDHERADVLTVEEPFEIRLSGQSLAVIMRTPGNDFELAMGFLFSEGIITSPDDVVSIEDAIDADGLPLANVVDVTLSTQKQQEQQACQMPQQGQQEQPQQAAFQRHFAVSSSCGLCGKNSIADLMINAAPLEHDALRFSATTIYELPTRLREAQSVFQHTGGLHAAGLFSQKGELLLSREDVGRHNAVDKLVGHGLLHGNMPYRERILMVSGRTSYEILQKALLARIPCVVSISAPSSLSVELANASGITLIGFLRDHSMNVYTHPYRIV
ncbi:MAG TPA: formate dehydrogenase accessory sulfurtransferase FdhD [Ktedonobacter sp.]|nr:formate dehydrogenase accessory sulfurtransferase FdhD [Ktedonobacter sp.]